MSDNNIYLTSGEIASLWTEYINDSMVAWVSKVEPYKVK